MLKFFFKIHFIGIGGIGISALARWFLLDKNLIKKVYPDRDYEVKISGSDLVDSDLIESLRKLGADIAIGPQQAKNLPDDCVLVIRTQAVPDYNPEVKKAQDLNIPVKTYSQILGELTKKFFTIAISGMHGKTTTTGLLAVVMQELGWRPTVIVGSKLAYFGDSNFHPGQDNYLIIEADEYRAAMLNYWPQIIVLLNLEEEHLDYYRDLADIERHFNKYVKHLPENGGLIVNAKCKIQNAKLNLKFKIIYDEQSDMERQDIVKHLKLVGKHNIENALAVWAVVKEINRLDKKYSQKKLKEKFLKSLKKFSGAWRRFEIKGEFDGITFIDDYAHHPTEIKATLQAAKEKYSAKRLVCIFQAHQIKRTQGLFKDFTAAFLKADKVLIADIYEVAGREEKIKDRLEKIWAKKLVKQIKNSVYVGDLRQLPDKAVKHLKSGDAVIMMGAGDVWLQTPALIKLWLLKDFGAKANVDLASFTNYRVGGPAEALVSVKNSQGLLRVIKICQQFSFPFRLLGGGSNTLVSDKGFKGVIILNRSQDFELLKDGLVRVDSGVNLGWLRQELLGRGFTGLEWTTGIFGTIGGAVFGNAGAYGSEIADFIESVEVYDTSLNRKFILNPSKICFGYRDSIFKHKPNYIILSAVLKLRRGEVTRSRQLIAGYNQRRQARPRLNTAGSVFKNIILENQTPAAKSKLLQAGLTFDKLARLSVGALIESLDLKGNSIGKASISKIHANYIVTQPGVKASDILKLINLIEKKAVKKFGIKLERENIVWND